MRTANLNNSQRFDRIVRGVLAPSIGARLPKESTQFVRLRAQLRDETLGFDPYVASSEARTHLKKIKDARKRVGFDSKGLYTMT